MYNRYKGQALEALCDRSGLVKRAYTRRQGTLILSAIVDSIPNGDGNGTWPY